MRTNGARRVRPNRVVLAVVATAKPCGGVASPTGRGAPSIREVTEASRNSSPGRARHTPSDHRAGKAGRFSASPVYPLCICVCISSHDGPRVPAGARPSLRPFFEGVKKRAKLGRRAPREGEGMSASQDAIWRSPMTRLAPSLRGARDKIAGAILRWRGAIQRPSAEGFWIRFACNDRVERAGRQTLRSCPGRRQCLPGDAPRRQPHECGEIASVRQKILCRRWPAAP